MQLPLAIAPALERRRDVVIDSYVETHREQYLSFAGAIAPDLASWSDVWDRLAFAILTANTQVAAAVAAFKAARGLLAGEEVSLAGLHGITAERERYVRTLPADWRVLAIRRLRRESWCDYRRRIRGSVEGLGFCKATYAACLLYPLEADVACLDTWMQRTYLGPGGFRALSADAYVELEGRVRRVGRRHGISTAIAQWAIWDWARGLGPTEQRFFS